MKFLFATIALSIFITTTLARAEVQSYGWQGNSWAVIALDKDSNFPPTNLSAMYSGACAPIASILIQIQGADSTHEAQKHRFDALTAAAAEVILKSCPALQTLHVGIVSNGNNVVWAGEAIRSRGWHVDASEVSTDRPGYSGIRFGRNLIQGGIKVKSDGFAEGYYLERGGLYGHFSGNTTPQESWGETTYIFDGMLYGHGDADRQCETSKDGYAYWGSLQLRVESWDMLDARGTFRPCSADESGTEGEIAVMKSAMGQSGNPFTAIDNLSVIENKTQRPENDDPDESIVLASGTGWKVTTIDPYWCINRPALRMDYDVPHAERATLFGGKFGPFFREHMEPQLRAACPSLETATITTFRSGEDLSWDTIGLFKPRGAEEGLRVEEITPGGAYVNLVYLRSCAGCHATGAGDAPVVGNSDDWPDRLDRLEYASWDELYHFNRLHCPDCETIVLELLARSMPRPGWATIDSYTDLQQRMMDYAAAPSGVNLLKSGLLNDSKVIAAIYQKQTSLYPSRQKLRSMFQDIIAMYDERCGKFLPGDAKEVLLLTTDFKREHTATTTTDTTTTRVDRGVRVDPKYYDTYAASPGNSVGLSDFRNAPLQATLRNSGRLSETPNLPMPTLSANVMLRTADVRALLANDARCTDPAIRQYMDNLHDAL